MMSLQATFQSTKEVKSDGVGQDCIRWVQQHCPLIFSDGLPGAQCTWPSNWDSFLSENIREDGDDKEDMPIDVTDYSLLY